MSAEQVNYSIRDEIQAFWSERAATFDQSVGHEIFSPRERQGWGDLLAKHLGAGAGRSALDLASGTGVISHLLHDAGFVVTGADWSEAMLEQARQKAKRRKADIRFILRDAENTMEPRQSYDVITCRHLVWTLVDPQAAFAEWFAVLRPGGKVLIIDANMGQKNWVGQLRSLLVRLRLAPAKSHLSAPMAARLAAIRQQVYFSDAMPAPAIVQMLEKAGFEAPIIDRQLGAIHRAQARHMPLWRGLERLAQDRYAICVTKP